MATPEIRPDRKSMTFYGPMIGVTRAGNYLLRSLGSLLIERPQESYPPSALCDKMIVDEQCEGDEQSPSRHF